MFERAHTVYIDIRLYIRCQYYVDGKREIGEHKFGDYPGYLTELELVSVKSRYYKGAQIPIFVSNYNFNRGGSSYL